MRIWADKLPAPLPFRLPLTEEFGEIVVGHGTSVGKLALALGVEKLSARVQHGNGGDAFVDGHAVFLREVEALVVTAHVNLDHHKVLSDQAGPGPVVELRVHRMTGRAPVGAAYQHAVLRPLVGRHACGGGGGGDSGAGPPDLAG